MTIITDAAKQGGRFGAAWQLAENQIIQLVRLTTPLSLLMVTQAMALAQHHIERAGEDDDEEAGAPTPALATGTRWFEEIASDKEEDIDFLAEDLKKRQGPRNAANKVGVVEDAEDAVAEEATVEECTVAEAAAEEELLEELLEEELLAEAAKDAEVATHSTPNR
eukprot:530724-Rhodomonas_salina.1